MTELRALDRDVQRAVELLNGAQGSPIERMTRRDGFLRVVSRLRTQPCNLLRITIPIVVPIDWSIVRANVLYLVAPQFTREVS